MQIENQIKLNKNELALVDALPAQEDIYRNLVNLQFHDLSEFRDNFDILEGGRFVWPFSACFESKNEKHHPLLILYKNKIVGFLIFSVFNGKKTNTEYYLVEMFILRMYRKKGIGKTVIQMIFDEFKGEYHLDIAEKNIAAIKFWEKLITVNSNKIDKKKFVEEGDNYINYVFVI